MRAVPFDRTRWQYVAERFRAAIPSESRHEGNDADGAFRLLPLTTCTMPNLIVRGDDLDNIIAYILSLKSSTAR